MGYSSQSAPSGYGGSSNSTQPYHGQQLGTGPYGLRSPAKMVNKFPGKNISSLRELTVALARNVVLSDVVLARSSRSGRNDSDQLDPQNIKSIIRGRVGLMGDGFELVWKKCWGKCVLS